MEDTKVCLKTLDKKVLCNEYFGLGQRLEGAEIACQRLYDLFYIVTGAQIQISEAEDKNLDINEWDCNEDEGLKNSLRIFLRGQSIKHAILDFNSVEDYVVQIACAILDLYKKDENLNENKRKQLEKAMSKVSWNSVKNKIETKDENLYNLMEKYKTDMKKLRNKYANTIKLRDNYANIIKHRYSLRWKGMSRPASICYKPLKYTEPKSIDIDEIVKYCKEINEIVVKYIEDVYNFVAEKYELTKINNI